MAIAARGTVEVGPAAFHLDVGLIHSPGIGVDWYNSERVHSAIRYVTQQEAEEKFYENLNADENAA